MELLILMLLAGAIAYLLASGRFKHQVEEKPAKPEVKTGWFGRGRKEADKKAEVGDFRAWALGAGAADFPGDFKVWLSSLTDEEAARFSTTLADYATGMGFSLSALVQGQLDSRPELRRVFVEALVIYSQAYRKLAEAQKKAQTPEVAEKEVLPPAEKQAAEKRPSRRKSDTPTETPDVAASAS